MSNRALHSEPPYDDALLRFSLWVVLLTAAGLLNLPMSPPEIPPWRVLIIVFSATLYPAFVVGLCLLSVSLLRRTAPPSPSPSPNRHQIPPGNAVLRLAICAMVLSAGGLFNLPTEKETQFGEVLVMFLTFDLGWVLLCLNLRKQRCPSPLLGPAPDV
ncbi:hypothetical protein QJS04_geneDACA014922 [Acorus gramineus]|uniref:Transmembrane protein n=1 Tax=Acorus gramineus TaxID=55184 RepID=A0AAV9BX39_ACOGR|nr:hypothetical protein QJS04_geneDACA014922 [Acorus gramineus]